MQCLASVAFFGPNLVLCLCCDVVCNTHMPNAWTACVKLRTAITTGSGVLCTQVRYLTDEMDDVVLPFFLSTFPTPFWFSIIMRAVLRVPSSSPPRSFVWPCADTRRSTTLTTRQALLSVPTRLLMRDFLLLNTKHKIRIRFTVRRPRHLRSATCYDGPGWVPMSSLYPLTPLTPTALAGTLALFLHWAYCSHIIWLSTYLQVL